MHFYTFRHILISTLLVFVVMACGSTKKCPVSEKIIASHFLVRHAEKVDDSKDPGLTKEGKERAYFLAEYLRDTTLNHIYSTDYFRTRLTAQPSSSIRNMDLKLYDASDLELFGQKILKKHKTENVLIAGHSNTTPQLISILCPSAEQYTIAHWEYDKLFRVDYYSDGSCSCERINYGKSSVEH